jgi:hypothetical protein
VNPSDNDWDLTGLSETKTLSRYLSAPPLPSEKGVDSDVARGGEIRSHCGNERGLQGEGQRDGVEWSGAASTELNKCHPLHPAPRLQSQPPN